MSIEQEIRDEIDNIKQLKIDVGDINNHLNALEGLCRDRNQKAVDDAYKRGYDKGYKDKTNNDEVCKELASEIYQRGLNDAWEAARKIACDEKLDLGALMVIFNSYSFTNIFRSHTASEAITKLKAYEREQKEDDIKRGDVVIRISDNARYLVTYVGDNRVSGTGKDGEWYAADLKNVRRTGEHYDISKILEKM